MRSQSGSVARIRSAPTCWACSMMASNTRGFSGLETCPGTFGKSPFGSAWGWYTSTWRKPVRASNGTDGRRAHAVQRRVDDVHVARAAEALFGQRREKCRVRFRRAQDDLAFRHGRRKSACAISSTRIT